MAHGGTLYGQIRLRSVPYKADFVKTLADPTRQMRLRNYAPGEKTVGEIAEALEIVQIDGLSSSGHLEGKGCCEARREGANVYYSLVNPKIGKPATWYTSTLTQMAKNRELPIGIIA